MPFNKGAHPNFWSFIENSPSGVTIHEINEYVDSGNIIIQKMIYFDLNKNKSLTFKNTYDHLFIEIENLFIQNFKRILDYKYKSYKQVDIGSLHTKKQLPKKFIQNWNQNILKVKKLFKIFI